MNLPNFFSQANESKINIVIMIRKIIYLYQKAFIVAIHEKKISLEQIPLILQYLKKFYILNKDLFINNPDLYNLEDLKDMKKLEELQNNSIFLQLIDNETLLIIQSLKTLSALITVLSYYAMV